MAVHTVETFEETIIEGFSNIVIAQFLLERITNTRWKLC